MNGLSFDSNHRIFESSSFLHFRFFIRRLQILLRFSLLVVVKIMSETINHWRMLHFYLFWNLIRPELFQRSFLILWRDVLTEPISHVEQYLRWSAVFQAAICFCFEFRFIEILMRACDLIVTFIHFRPGQRWDVVVDEPTLIEEFRCVVQIIFSGIE